MRANVRVKLAVGGQLHVTPPHLPTISREPACVSAMRSRSLSSAPALDVEVDGGEDDEPSDDVLERKVNTRLDQPLVENANDDRSQERSGHGPDAAGEAGSSHDHRGDGDELEVLARTRLCRVEPGSVDRPSDAGQQRAGDTDRDHVAGIRNSRVTGRFAITSNGVQMLTE